MSDEIRGPLGVVIVAAGSGVRFGDPAKALAIAAGKPLLEYSLRLFTNEPTVDQIVVVFGNHTLNCRSVCWLHHYGFEMSQSVPAEQPGVRRCEQASNSSIRRSVS